MTDRELLELAAKAADVYLTVDWLGHHKYNPTWNSLDDDGDALRLAVKLGFDVDVEYERTVVRGEVHLRLIDLEEQHENDPCAATRRAITRAAAEIGKAMK